MLSIIKKSGYWISNRDCRHSVSAPYTVEMYLAYFREAIMGEWNMWRCDIRPIKLLKPVHRVSIAHYLDKIRKVSSPHVDFKSQDEWSNNRELITRHAYFSTLLLPRPAPSSDRNLQTTCERILVFWNKTAFQSVKKKKLARTLKRKETSYSKNSVTLYQ
jgi:hypothetical protein